jgi:hypothetical protein
MKRQNSANVADNDPHSAKVATDTCTEIAQAAPPAQINRDVADELPTRDGNVRTSFRGNPPCGGCGGLNAHHSAAGCCIAIIGM